MNEMTSEFQQRIGQAGTSEAGEIVSPTAGGLLLDRALTTARKLSSQGRLGRREFLTLLGLATLAAACGPEPAPPAQAAIPTEAAAAASPTATPRPTETPKPPEPKVEPSPTPVLTARWIEVTQLEIGGLQAEIVESQYNGQTQEVAKVLDEEGVHVGWILPIYPEKIELVDGRVLNGQLKVQDGVVRVPKAVEGRDAYYVFPNIPPEGIPEKVRPFVNFAASEEEFPTSEFPFGIVVHWVNQEGKVVVNTSPVFIGGESLVKAFVDWGRGQLRGLDSKSPGEKILATVLRIPEKEIETVQELTVEEIQEIAANEKNLPRFYKLALVDVAAALSKVDDLEKQAAVEKMVSELEGNVVYIGEGETGNGAQTMTDETRLIFYEGGFGAAQIEQAPTALIWGTFEKFVPVPGEKGEYYLQLSVPYKNGEESAYLVRPIWHWPQEGLPRERISDFIVVDLKDADGQGTLTAGFEEFEPQDLEFLKEGDLMVVYVYAGKVYRDENGVAWLGDAFIFRNGGARQLASEGVNPRVLTRVR